MHHYFLSYATSIIHSDFTLAYLLTLRLRKLSVALRNHNSLEKSVENENRHHHMTGPMSEKILCCFSIELVNFFTNSFNLHEAAWLIWVEKLARLFPFPHIYVIYEEPGQKNRHCFCIKKKKCWDLIVFVRYL